jgi:hypothetical protein
MTEPSTQPLQIHGVAEAVKLQFRVYSVAHAMTQADAFTHMFLTLLASEHETAALEHLRKLGIQKET